jgi:hypothetical protein
MTDDSTQANLIWLALPIALSIAVLVFSPNFRHHSGDADAVRNTPLGSDFLQEYVGGKVFWSEDRDRLYELPFVRSLQHDPDVVGFAWQEDNYFPMVYPPFYYASQGLFSSIDYLTAFRIWLVLLGLATAATGFLLVRFYPPVKNSLGTIVVLALLFAPLLLNFNMAQKGSWLLLILTATFVLLYQRKSWTAGLLFGAICFKPHLGLVIGISMFLKRDWKFCSGALTTIAVIAGGSWVLFPGLWADYSGIVLGMTDYVQSGGYQLADSHSLWGATELTLRSLLPSSSKWIAIILGLTLLGFLAGMVWPRCEYSSPKFGLQFAAMVVVTVLLSPHFYTYDLTILLLAFLLIACSFQKEWRQDRLSIALAGCLTGFFVLSGVFRTIAENTGIQFSVLLLIGILVLLSMAVHRSSFSSPAVR